MTASGKGQAWYVLRGYRYQLLLSLDAWLGLRADEVLFLETEEDFSVESDAVAVDTQVKSSAAKGGPNPHSLRSQDVRTVLSRFWQRSDHGRDPRPQLAFVAQGGIAREQGLAFPNNAAGIEYWRAAVLGADTAPLRVALASIFEGEPIGEWINGNPSDQELLNRLLSRVKWMLDSLDEKPLIDLIRDRVAEIYLEKGLWVTLADDAIHSLFDRVFDAASQPEASNRRLTSVDLHRSIEAAAIPLMALRGAATGTGGRTDPEGLLVSTVESPAGNLVDRHDAVLTIVGQTGGEPLIWLHGTHGIGKSTLARLIAARLGGSWLEVDLRPVQDDPKGALAAWRDLVRAVNRAPHIEGIIIDDLTGNAFETLRARLSAFVTSTAPQGKRVIISSLHEPSSARLAALGASPRAALQAPYFSETDVRVLVTASPAPPAEAVEAWTRLLLITSKGGHPLLVAAKVASLRSRGWPVSALIEDVGPTASDAVRATREEARRRLLAELPSSDARQLLRRLGNVFDRADSALILKLARQDPPIANAGDVLTILRGSWIEVVPGNDMRLSPLIADIGTDLAEDEIIRCRQTAAEHWLSTGALDQRTLPLCFWNALWGKHTSILMHICQAIETLPSEQIRGAAALLSPMTLLRTDYSIYPEVAPIGAMLRLLQVEVANAIEDDQVGREASEALMLEIATIDHEELRLLTSSISIPKLLLAEHLDLGPAVQLDLALRLRVVLKDILAISDPALRAPTHWLRTGLPVGVDLPGFLFAVIVMRIRSSARMLAMIETLDALKEEDRNNFLDAARISLGMGGGMFVHHGWAQEQLDNLDLRPALDRFDRMSEIARHWRSDIRAELANARSILLDEGFKDQSAALAAIDIAIREIGSMPTLVRQKAKVLSHSSDDLAAATLLISVEDAIGIDSPIERALALREGAISAARAKLFTDALRLFGKACESLVAEGQHQSLVVGLQLESALSLWEMNDRPHAILMLADVLDGVEQLDPTISRQHERAHQFARATIGLFWRKLDAYSSGPTRDIAIGQASALTGDEGLLGVDLKPLADYWRILALCEIEVGVDMGVERRSLAKQKGPGFPSVEMFITMARYARDIVDGNNLSESFRLGLLAAFASWELRQSREGAVKLDRMPSSSTEILQVLLRAGLIDVVKAIPVDLLIWRRYHGKWDAGFAARIDTASKDAWGDAAAIADIVSAASGGTFSGTPSPAVALAANLAAMPDLRGNPRARFERDLLLVSHTAHSLARRIIESVVVLTIANGWSEVLANESFALRSPMQHLPPIEAAIGDMNKLGLKAAARLLLAAAPAVGVSLSQNWEQLLCQIVG